MAVDAGPAAPRPFPVMTPALRRVTHLAALAALAAWALAFGRWLRAPDPGASLWALIVIATALGLALHRVYGRRQEEVEEVARPEAAVRLDVNAAGAEELVRLPGVGPVMAARIVAERQTGGPFASLEDLTRVPGVGAARVRVLAEHARAG
jgi:competence ComEA-like helix-hairpin-helix protein